MSVTDKLNIIISERKIEVDKKYGKINSLHEGYALTLEELSELNDELDQFKEHFECLWEGIRKNYIGPNNFYGNSLKKALVHAKLVASEVIDLIIVLERMNELV